MRIIIGADIVPTDSNKDFFIGSRMSEIVGSKLVSCLKNADFRVFNLECPLTDREQPITKCGPNLIAPAACVAGLSELDVDLLTLANNHILDQGSEGLSDTMESLEKAGIAFLGVGAGAQKACTPYVLERDGLKIGFYACAEHEFSIAADGKLGANPFDSPASFLHVAELKRNCDRVVVLYHGGKEHYRYPSPVLQKTLRSFVDVGADLVLSQHSHCIGCREEYKGSVIVYGQGNFLFDGDSSEYWNTSMLVLLDVEKESMSVSYVPLERKGNGVELSENGSILADFEKRSDQITEEGFIESSFESFVGDYLEAMVRDHKGIKKFILKVIKWGLKHFFGKKLRLLLLNYVECEAQREVLITGLKNSI